MQKIRNEFLCTFLAIAVLLGEQIFVHSRACYCYIISQKHNHWHHLHPGAGNCFIIALVHLTHFDKWRRRRCLSMHTISFSSLNKNTKCPIDAHCHRHCREDLRIINVCIEFPMHSWCL